MPAGQKWPADSEGETGIRSCPQMRVAARPCDSHSGIGGAIASELPPVAAARLGFSREIWPDMTPGHSRETPHRAGLDV